jgi:hypothetical protein
MRPVPVEFSGRARAFRARIEASSNETEPAVEKCRMDQTAAVIDPTAHPAHSKAAYHVT